MSESPPGRPLGSAKGRATDSHELPRVVIVGAGQTGRELARQLAGERRVVVLDTDQQKLDRLRSEATGQSFETLLRDGTSALALKAAAGDGAEWVIAATDQDTVNIEVCRVAAELTPRPSTIGTLRESHRAGRLRATGAESIARPGSDRQSDPEPGRTLPPGGHVARPRPRGDPGDPGAADLPCGECEASGPGRPEVARCRDLPAETASSFPTATR